MKAGPLLGELPQELAEDDSSLLPKLVLAGGALRTGERQHQPRTQVEQTDDEVGWTRPARVGFEPGDVVDCPLSVLLQPQGQALDGDSGPALAGLVSSMAPGYADEGRAKGQVTAPPLDLRGLGRAGATRVSAFCERYIVVPKGTGARKRMKLRPWQRVIVRGVLAEPRPRQGLVSIPAGNGKRRWPRPWGLLGCSATAWRAPRSWSWPATSGKRESSSTPLAAWSS